MRICVYKYQRSSRLAAAAVCNHCLCNPRIHYKKVDEIDESYLVHDFVAAPRHPYRNKKVFMAIFSMLILQLSTV